MDIHSKRSKEALEIYLRRLYAKKELQDALLLASPDFFPDIQRWLEGTQPASEKILKTLYKYTIRMSTRPTPYGLFAGVALGKIEEQRSTDIYRNNNESARFRLDMQCLVNLANIISMDREIRCRLSFYPNNTIYRQLNLYKFYQHKPGREGSSNFLSAVQITPALEYVIEKSAGGITYQNLLKELHEKGTSKAAAESFLNRLIDSQLLISELQPNITGEDFLSVLIMKMSLFDVRQRYLTTLQRIDFLLRSDYSLADRKLEIETLLGKLSQGIHYRYLLQGDQIIGTDRNSLASESASLITQQLQELLPLAISNQQPDMERFKEAFTKRYEGRLVPLLEVLDPDTGIGYGDQNTDYRKQDNLLRDIRLNLQEQKKRFSVSPFEELLLRKYTEAIEKGIRQVNLSAHDLSELKSIVKENNSLPPTFYALGNLLADDQKEGNLKFNLHGYGGTSAANLMSRFGYLNNEIENKLTSLCDDEQHKYSSVIFAEIIHLPEARTGNILQRPQLRHFEIAILAKSSEGAYTIDADDLHLFIQHKRLVLWSKNLQKEIIPRLTSAHNYHAGIQLYRFLGDLQSHYYRLNVKWDWGILRNQRFLPRITYRDIILSRATWNIPQQAKDANTGCKEETLMRQLIETYALPQQIMLTEGDNDLLLDLFHPLAGKIFLEKLFRGNVVLHESLFSQYQSPVLDEKGNMFSNELVIPFHSGCRAIEEIRPPQLASLTRSFPLGTEWVYVSIYCGFQYAEKILQDFIPKIIGQLKENDMLKKWFFIRYHESGHHIRLRIEGKLPGDFSVIVQLIQEIFKAPLQADLISKLQFDTYIREIERYSEDHMEVSEELFFRDSEYVLELVRSIPRSCDRWMAGMIGIDHLLEGAGFTLDEKNNFCEKRRTSFAQEFGNDNENKKTFSQIFRERKTLIETHLCCPYQSATTEATIRFLVAKELFTSLRKSPDRQDLATDKTTHILASHAHMFINRLFAFDQRLHELATYHFLNNFYRMQLGKLKSSGKIL